MNYFNFKRIIFFDSTKISLLLKGFIKKLNKVFSSDFSFLQLLFSIKILWWGIGGVLGVKFIIWQLNYLINFPLNIILIGVGLFGFYSLLAKKYLITLSFSILNLFLFSSVSLTFFHSFRSNFWSISGGNYLLETLAAIWMTFRVKDLVNKDSKYI